MDGIDAGRHLVLSALMFYSSWFLSQFFEFYDNFILTVDLSFCKTEHSYGLVFSCFWCLEKKGGIKHKPAINAGLCGAITRTKKKMYTGRESLHEIVG